MIHEGLSGGANTLFCVFDGHGVEGEKCSRHVAGHLPSLLVHSAHFKVITLQAYGLECDTGMAISNVVRAILSRQYCDAA